MPVSEIWGWLGVDWLLFSIDLGNVGFHSEINGRRRNCWSLFEGDLPSYRRVFRVSLSCIKRIVMSLYVLLMYIDYLMFTTMLIHFEYQVWVLH